MEATYFKSTDELAIINVWGENAEPEEESDGFVESWANLALNVVEVVDTIAVADYDGTTGGDQDGINILVEAEKVDEIIAALEAAGFTAERSPMAVEVGHFGDGGWEGYDLAEVKFGDDRDGYLLVDGREALL